MIETTEYNKSIDMIKKSVDILNDLTIFTYEKYMTYFNKVSADVVPITKLQWDQIVSLKCDSKMVYSNSVKNREGIILKAAENIIKKTRISNPAITI